MKQIDFELVPHTADIRLRVFGKTLKDLFKHALIGMFQAIGPHAAGCERVDDRLVCKMLPIKRELALDSIDHHQLLINFLNDAWYLADVHNEAYLDTDILELTDTHIQAILKGVQIERFEVVEIKAITHHGGPIQKTDEGWTVDIVIDI